MNWHSWQHLFNTQFGDLDSRALRWSKGEVRGAAGPISSTNWEPCYCTNCGADGGYVTCGTPIIYLCEPCAHRLGDLPLPKVPVELEREYRPEDL